VEEEVVESRAGAGLESSSSSRKSNTKTETSINMAYQGWDREEMLQAPQFINDASPSYDHL